MADYRSEHARSIADPEGFWGEQAGLVDWIRTPTRVLDAERPPFYRWYPDGVLNTCYNALDRHLEARGDQPALIYDSPVTGTVASYTYRELTDQVAHFAGVLSGIGVGKGDRVIIYMPMVPEAVFAMLACARIGAVHSVVFGGFSAEALRDRINDAEAKVLITATSGYRRGNLVPLKRVADDAVGDCPSIQAVVVVMRRSATEEAEDTLRMQSGRDRWYHELVRDADAECTPAWVESEHMLYTLYTSGTTGKPKGLIHTTGGYLTGCYATTKWVFDLKEEGQFGAIAVLGLLMLDERPWAGASRPVI